MKLDDFLWTLKRLLSNTVARCSGKMADAA